MCQTSPVLLITGSSGISAAGPSSPGRERTRWTASACRENTAKFTPPGRSLTPYGVQWPRETVKRASVSAAAGLGSVVAFMLGFVTTGSCCGSRRGGRAGTRPERGAGAGPLAEVVGEDRLAAAAELAAVVGPNTLAPVPEAARL